MLQMNDTAGSSMTHMAATLTVVVRDLSEGMDGLGTQMAAALQKSAEQTSGATSGVVDKWRSGLRAGL